MQPKRILFVIDYYLPHRGGLETMFSSLITRLQAYGYTIGIITMQHEKSLPTEEELGSLLIRRGGRNRLSFARYAFRKTLRVGASYDLIHTTTYAGAMPAARAGRLLKKQVVLTVHEVFGTLRKKLKPFTRPFYRGFERILIKTYKNNTTVAAVSEYTKTCLIDQYQLQPDNIHRIYNGVDTTIWNRNNIDQSFVTRFLRQHSLEKNSFLLYTGHPGCSKGIDEFIAALPAVLTHFPSLPIVLNLLPGKRRHLLEKKVQPLTNYHRIILLNGLQQQELLTLMTLSKAVVVPSRSEGFGLVAAEVSTLEQPLIISRNGALPEVVSGKIVFLDGLAPHDFVNAVEKLVAQDFSSVPPKVFSWDSTADHYMHVYSKM